jgi:hypothetical protein
MKTPKKIPEKGYYYHYKHNPSLAVNNYAYEILGVGIHTEMGHDNIKNDCRPEDAHMVVYRPIYEASVYKAGKFFDIRPLEIFIEKVTKDRKTFPRFKKIVNKKIIAKLEKIKREMYGLD